MRKTIRIRCILILIVFALLAAGGIAAVLSSADAFALSALSKGSGTENDPYLITTVNQLTNLQEISTSDLSEEYTKGKYFRLERDLATAYNNIFETNGFYGHLDGNGHTVRILSKTGLFYRLAGDASITNLTVAVDLEVDYALEFYGLVYLLDSNAVIDNCQMRGNINIDFSSWEKRTEYKGIYLYFGMFAIINNGTISNSSFQGTVTQPNLERFGSQSTITGSIFAPSGNGKVVNCVSSGDVQLVVNAYSYSFSVFSASNKVINCNYTGNVSLTLAESIYVGVITRVFAIGRYAESGTFVGNIVFDYNNQQTMNAARHYVGTSQNAGCEWNGNYEEINKFVKPQ